MYGQMEYVSSDSEEESKTTGEEIDTDVSRLSQRYSIDFDRQLFPYVYFRSGVALDRLNNRVTTDDARSKFTDQTRTYFFELTLDNPDYRAGLTYRDTDDNFDGSSLADEEVFREGYTGFFHWSTANLPSIDLNYRHAKVHDKPRTRDTVADFWNFETRYAYRNLAFDYSYIRTDRDERIEGSGSVDDSHDGRLRYTTRLAGGRVSVSASSRFTYNTSDPSDGEAVRLPTASPLTTFYLLDDSTPASNTPGEFTTVDVSNPLTNVDIGPAGPPNLISFGVEFPSLTKVDTLYASPLENPEDFSLASPAEINSVAHRFSWRVFSSPDQETWTELTLTGAVYDAFENRFEISLASPMDVRFIKVVTQPLLSGNTGKILISQLQTLETVAGSEGATVRNFRQLYDLALQYEISRDTTTSYSLYYRTDDLTPSVGRRTWLTNSIGLRHVFGPRLVGDVGYLRTVTGKPDRDHGVQDSFRASLRADHLDTFYQTLTYSMLHDQQEGGSTASHTLWLRNNLELHPSWTANVDLGYLRRRPIEGDSTSGVEFRVISNLDPNPRMNFRLDHVISWTREKHEGTRRRHDWTLQSFLVPTEVLSLLATLNYRDEGSGDHEFSQDYAVNWAPFRDSALEFSLSYRRFKNRQGRDEETINPQLRWQIRPGLLATLRYSTGVEESEFEETDINVLTAGVQFSLR